MRGDVELLAVDAFFSFWCNQTGGEETKPAVIDKSANG
jgi:hypothetical protein